MTNGFFDNDDPFGLPPVNNDATGTNAPVEISVSDLSQQLKRLVEGKFSFVRVRGELSRVTVAKSGHLYTSLKDDSAVLDAVCWKGTVSRLSLRPAEGMEVVCTGRLTTYPGRSNYQLVIETMELAGQGALLKMLEDRKKKLAAEGLFDAGRKKKIPFLPRRIGVITSPTGAVIRDIMHRINDRFPVPVLLYPVIVQGATAAAAVTKAIADFNNIPAGHDLRPDVIIVARGGGSFEDLMPFNDEQLVRAAAASVIPLISAVGHETDTTLIDFAADLRAPTPTAAAEKSVPVRAELALSLRHHKTRMAASMHQRIKHARTALTGMARGLGDPRRMFENLTQRMDHLSVRLDGGLQSWLDKRAAHLREMAARVSPNLLQQKIAHHRQHATAQGERLNRAAALAIQKRQEQLKNRAALLDSLSFERVLERGYSVVADADGKIVSSATQARGDVTLRFRDGTRAATVKDDKG